MARTFGEVAPTHRGDRQQKHATTLGGHDPRANCVGDSLLRRAVGPAARGHPQRRGTASCLFDARALPLNSVGSMVRRLEDQVRGIAVARSRLSLRLGRPQGMGPGAQMRPLAAMAGRRILAAALRRGAVGTTFRARLARIAGPGALGAGRACELVLSLRRQPEAIATQGLSSCVMRGAPARALGECLAHVCSDASLQTT